MLRQHWLSSLRWAAARRTRPSSLPTSFSNSSPATCMPRALCEPESPPSQEGNPETWSPASLAFACLSFCTAGHADALSTCSVHPPRTRRALLSSSSSWLSPQHSQAGHTTMVYSTCLQRSYRQRGSFMSICSRQRLLLMPVLTYISNVQLDRWRECARSDNGLRPGGCRCHYCAFGKSQDGDRGRV